SSQASIDQFNEFRQRPDAVTDIVRTEGPREKAYELAGRAVVDRSDVMIVVWDGEPARGRGGTAEIYSYAQRWQKPILLISIDENSAKLDKDRLPRVAKGKTPLSPESMKRLDEYNKVRMSKAAFDASPPLLLVEASSPDWLKSTAQLTGYVS